MSGRWQALGWRGSLAIGILALLVLALPVILDARGGGAVAPARALQAYAYAFVYWSDLAVGALPLLLIYHLTGGAWGREVRFALDALTRLLTITAVLALPVVLGVRWIYPWMDPLVAAEPKILHKQVYLGAGSFALRTVLYFAAWALLGHFRRRFAREGEAGDARLRNLSAGGLVLFGFLVSFAAIDWQMSADPLWHSTIYGMVYAIGQALSAYAAALVIFAYGRGARDAEPLSKKTRRDLGNILLTLVMLWAYLSFMQYLVIWSGNLPHEVTWFVRRTQGGWQWPVLLLAAFQFGAPFLCLLFRATKDSPRRLAFLGALILGVRAVDHYWSLMPGLRPGKLELAWEPALAWIGVGGIWLAAFWRNSTQGARDAT